MADALVPGEAYLRAQANLEYAGTEEFVYHLLMGQIVPRGRTVVELGSRAGQLLYGIKESCRVSGVESSEVLRGLCRDLTVHPGDPLTYVPETDVDYVLSVHDPCVRTQQGRDGRTIQTSLSVNDLGAYFNRLLPNASRLLFHTDFPASRRSQYFDQDGGIFMLSREEHPTPDGAQVVYTVSANGVLHQESHQFHRYDLEKILQSFGLRAGAWRTYTLVQKKE